MVIGRGALVLCMLASAMAVSSPEIAAGKSTKASATTVAANQQQQQQQQKATQLRSQQDAHLNSINAYATNYQAAAAAAAANQQQSNPSTFKPSHSYSAQVYSSQPAAATTKLISVPTNVDIENNFQPMPAVQAVGQLTQSSPPSPSQPVIMQYLPQTQMHDGIQYLQLIPTRPLMVPISPYLSALSNQQTQTSAAAAAVAAYHPQPHHHHQILSPSNVVDYAARPAVLSPIHAPQPLSPLHSIAAAADAPYGLQTYANSLQNYRAYRINREVRDKNLPPNFTLNMYEYMPTPNDAPQHYIIRPRP